MNFKEERFREQFKLLPPLLQFMGYEFAEIALTGGIVSFVTRVSDAFPGESGVHPLRRAIDFRDEFPKDVFMYPTQLRLKLLDHFNRKYARRDNKPTLLWHSFAGGPRHFHLQIPPDLARYIDKPEFDLVKKEGEV